MTDDDQVREKLRAITPEELDPHEAIVPTVEALIDALEPLGFESNVIATDGSEPAASLMLDNGQCLDVTVTLRMWCGCCELDGTHHHERCDHPCCLEGDE